MKMLLLASLFVLAGLPLRAQDYEISDGQSLKRYCEVAKKSSKGDKLTEAETDILIYGRGYVTGMMDDGSLGAAVLRDVVQPYLIPEGTTNNQVALVVLKFMEGHPEFINRPACLIIGRALMDAFPNPKAVNPRR